MLNRLDKTIKYDIVYIVSNDLSKNLVEHIYTNWVPWYHEKQHRIPIICV